MTRSAQHSDVKPLPPRSKLTLMLLANPEVLAPPVLRKLLAFEPGPVNREVVRMILRRVAETDAELLALLDAPTNAGGRPRGGDENACKRGHPRSEMVSRLRRSSGKTFQECGACKRLTSRENKGKVVEGGA